MKKTGPRLFVFFLLLVAVTVPLVGLVNYSFVLPLWKQIQARSYVTTKGVIQRANIRRRQTSDHVSISLILSYTYEVDGVRYESQRYRYARDSSGTYLREVVEELRRQRIVSVM